MKWSKYSKLWMALLGAVVTTVVTYFTDVQWLQALVPFLTAIGVYQVKNTK